MTLADNPAIKVGLRNITVPCTGHGNVHLKPAHCRAAAPVTCSEPSLLTVAVKPLPSAGP
ncbi:hypothetical protein BLIG_01481 [Bifidobacterium longum subsp. infantis CCUG 52486]|uniref:Uncharacterized protein n=1 Tax=Bifidobacterium longum subsp. infantis CCUG 52486 TaxID=537937 RepID=C5ECJ9_BIFLI|nr:hypothetical protein BLIG_01481 [Bifidobacterium longum subsp. infantis CCUG 52486]